MSEEGRDSTTGSSGIIKGMMPQKWQELGLGSPRHVPHGTLGQHLPNSRI